MTEFVRFPRTPHLVWLGASQPRDDKVMSPADAAAFLGDEVAIEEKLDGANVGISLGPDDSLRVQNRGEFIAWDSAHPQFGPLRQWLSVHRYPLLESLTPELILFGEWCYAAHSIQYTRLPDWFIAFDVYDRAAERFWSIERRDRLVARAGIAAVPMLARGRFDVDGVAGWLGPSQFAEGPAEGVYVRRDRGVYLEQRAKLPTLASTP